ncbi:unnamed protein product, partial [Polarella glacialis]
VPLNMQKLKTAMKKDAVIHFRQFQSTTSDSKVAEKFARREDKPGFIWKVEVPKDFWGARDIHDVAWRAKEAETLFMPYSAFKVLGVDGHSCHLISVSPEP